MNKSIGEIYQHHSGEKYRLLFHSFNVSTQDVDVVYMQLSTGTVFNRPKAEFYSDKFKLIDTNIEDEVQPKQKVTTHE